jgi:hypothetical protein
MQAVGDGLRTIGRTLPGERGYSLAPYGSAFPFFGGMTLVTECTAPASHAATCLPFMGVPSSGAAVRGCVRLSCESSSVGVTDVFVSAQPGNTPESRGSLSYASERPQGRISYDPSPLVSWRVDVREVSAIQVMAEYTHGLTHTGVTGAILDLSHTGRVRMMRSGDTLGSTSVALQFSRVSDLGVELEVTGNEGSAMGQVVSRGFQLATVSGSFITGLDFRWAGACVP